MTNVNIKQLIRVISLNITSTLTLEYKIAVTNVNIKLLFRVILLNISRRNTLE